MVKILKCPKCKGRAYRLYIRNESNGVQRWKKTDYVFCKKHGALNQLEKRRD